MQIIFQDPYSSLSPRLPVGEIIGEAVREHSIRAQGRVRRLHRPRSWSECGLQPVSHATAIRTSSPAVSASASASPARLALNPEFVVCDEPVSALDVSIQAQIINLLTRSAGGAQPDLSVHLARPVRRRAHFRHASASCIWATWWSSAPTEDIFAQPLHPYTKALFSAIPVPDPNEQDEPHRAARATSPLRPTRRPAASSIPAAATA